MWSEFDLSQEMLQMGRFPAFGRPRPPPQRRVLRTIHFTWCDKHCAPAQRNCFRGGHLELGDVVFVPNFMNSWNRLWSSYLHWNSSNNSLMTPWHHLNHPYSILRTSFFIILQHRGSGVPTISLPEMKFWWRSILKSEAPHLTRLSGARLVPPEPIYQC